MREILPITFLRPNDTVTRLYVFPHGGGEPTAYRGWADELPDGIEVVSVALPGRGALRDAPSFTDWADLVDSVTAMMAAHLDGTPFAFFGHSFGALLAFEVCRALRRRGLALPVCLFLSAHRAAHLPSVNADPARQSHGLPQDGFIEAVRAWGGIPDRLLEDPAALAFLLPALRADIRLDETHVFVPEEPLALRCVVYGGDADKSVSFDDLAQWRSHVAPDSSFTQEMFPGGHFFTVDAQADVLASVAAHVTEALAGARPSVLWEGAADFDTTTDIWTLFLRQSARTPRALALEDGSRQWSFRELERAVGVVAGRLSRAGIGYRDTVGIFMPHCAEYEVALLAVLSLGASACLLEKNWSDALLGEFLEAAQAKMVISVPDVAGRLPETFRSGCLVLAAGWDVDPGNAELPPGVTILPDDIAFISMTSGSTGKPKAVLTTHRGCTYCFLSRFRLYPYREDEREGMNVFFAWECLRPLLAGRPAVMIPDDVIFDPQRLVDLIETARITRLVVTSSLLESVLDHPRLAPILSSRLSHMEAWFLMGEVVPVRLVEKAARLFPPGLKLVNAYSTWESLDVAYGDLLPMGIAGSSAPVGRPMPGCAALILDEDGRVVPSGVTGELYVAGPGIAPGYLRDDVKTAERFLPLFGILAATGVQSACVYRTGDRARVLADGSLEILGRIDSTVKIRGFKVSLPAVERALDGVEGISRLVVVPLKDAETAQPKSLIVYAVGEGGEPSDTALAKLRQRARRQLPEYAAPSHYVGLANLPMRQGESRKLDVTALPLPDDGVRAATGPTRLLSSIEDNLASAWRDVLGLAEIGPDDNFFALGGNSLSAAKLSGVLADRFGIVLPVVDIFQYGTLADMAVRCGAPVPRTATAPRRRSDAGSRHPKLAIIGMAGRFPGADSLDEFWVNLLAGRDSLRRFGREELLAKGIPDHVLDHPNWVSAGQVMDGVDRFDARFWGIGPSEAELMDPQHRVFIETAWTALEQAGYARRGNPYAARTGVFASCGIDGYLVHHLNGGGMRDWLDPGRLFLTEIGNEKDYASSRVAFLMDLGGPAITVSSACSSALVAVVSAARALMDGECDMAVAGGVALTFPNMGYCYEEGLVGSADGHVRPFDDQASGTLFGDSVGAVVLKRLDDAMADGDPIWAVVSGVGSSNDGRMKAGYAAPSAQAQARCIVDAMTMAGVSSERISYVECHATATHVGDAIELKGLYDAFVEMRQGETFTPFSCALGSVKGNIGHANGAAGITGLIKTVLALHHRTLVPTANFATLNPRLVEFVDHDGTPFTIHRGLSDWEPAVPSQQVPRIAGVSSFGIGGTNAHVILEEAPPRPPATAEGFVRSHHLLTVSAKTPGALTRNLHAMAAHVAGLDAAGLASSAFTLHKAREAHPLRLAAVVERNPQAAAAALRGMAAGRPSRTSPGHQATIAFCFSGQGSQHVGMARGLYRGRGDGGRFRRHFDAACAALAAPLGFDPASAILDGDDIAMRRPIVTQCGLFAVEYALASSLSDLGIKPVAVAGHSIGEYAAAVSAGVLEIADAAALVAARASATEDLVRVRSASGEDAEGGMMSVVGDEDGLRRWLEGRSGLWLAVENAPGQMVVAGAVPDLETAARDLVHEGYRCTRVPVSHPFHSVLMEPVAERLERVASAISGKIPRIPMTSNVTGEWLGDEAVRGDYWSRHLLATVRWKDNVSTLLRWRPDVILEIGPGTVLSGLIGKCLQAEDGDHRPLVLPSMRHAQADVADEAVFADMLGRLWCAGAALDWRAYHQGEIAAEGAALERLRLPTYSFEPDSYWVNDRASIYVDQSVARPNTVEPPHDAATPASGPAAAPSPWLVRAVARPNAQIRLYCFPFAGGSSRSFEDWARQAPDWLDVIAVEMPGRNARAEEAVAADDESDMSVQAALADSIRADAGQVPIALCGLSYGATLALELLAGPLADLDRRGQVKGLAVVGRAPLLGGERTEEVDPEDLLMAPPEIRENKVWRAVFLPLLLADLAADARAARRLDALYRRNGGEAPLRCPLEVHCGLDDVSFAWGDADRWRNATSGAFGGIHYYRGGHGFMIEHHDRILARLVDFLTNGSAPGQGDWRQPAVLHSVQWIPQARPRITADAVPWIEASPGPDAADRLADLLAQGGAAGMVVRSRLGVVGNCADFVRLLQRLLERGTSGRLILVLPPTVEAGPMDGMARAFALENDVLRLQCVFAEGHPDHGEAGAQEGDWPRGPLSSAMACPDEPALWWRSGFVSAQRLLPLRTPPLARGVLGATGDRFLVTGGTGGLGGALVDWLLDHQGVAPSRVIVTGRRLRAEGPRGARYVAVDLADPVAVEAELAKIGPIAGLFHLAGILDDGVVQNLDESRIAAVLAPKLALAALLRLAENWGSRWAVAYSSTSSLLGTGGQANYAAANAWMDHLAAWPGDSGPPILASINWGTWADVGMGARNAKALERARRDGETPLTTTQAMDALSAVVASLLADAPSGRRFAACRIDWDRSPWRRLPLLSHLDAQAGPIPTVERPFSTSPIPHDPAGTGSDPVRTFLGHHVRHWEDDAQLSVLGFDSLDFAQLRSGFLKQFGIQVPLSVFATPNRTLRELAAHLSAVLADHRPTST